ncbi:MAG: hypothetical protein ACHQ51_02450 [Elusimicrobiota bacterium]
MKRLIISLLLVTAGAARAALPRVIVDVPLAPVSAPGAMGSAPAAAALFAAPAAASMSPALAVPAAQPLAPLLAPAAALPSLPAPQAAPAPAAKIAPAPTAIGALRANAPLAAALAENLKTMPLEDAAPALDANFAAAASLGSNIGDGGAALPPAGGTPAADIRSSKPLLARLLQRVRIDDEGHPERRGELLTAFLRMLTTPTARGLAERYLAEGAPAVVRFEQFEGSRIYDVNGRKIFYAPRAFTEWKGDHVEVRLNLDYLGANAEFREQDLPPTLAHELLGHGLWNARAEREKAFQAFHHHELNETNARLVGWMVDFELDRRFEENGAWTYLADPSGFLSHLKLRLPYYALTFSNQELARPIEALETRSAEAKSKRAWLEMELANHVSWNPVIDHFAKNHGVSEGRLRALRAYMTDNEASYKDEIAVMDALIAEVDATVQRMKAEPDRVSERYLQWAATHPMFADLARETEENGRRLLDLVRSTPAQASDESADAARRRDLHWRGQITFDEMVSMYHRDRKRNPSHWSR